MEMTVARACYVNTLAIGSLVSSVAMEVNMQDKGREESSKCMRRPQPQKIKEKGRAILLPKNSAQQRSIKID